jgi:hypothetical protein
MYMYIYLKRLGHVRILIFWQKRIVLCLNRNLCWFLNFKQCYLHGEIFEFLFLRLELEFSANFLGGA